MPERQKAAFGKSLQGVQAQNSDGRASSLRERLDQVQIEPEMIFPAIMARIE